ncbi:50S ribosomal protein L16 [Candidatus Woesearchaeota archaeon]|nr:50S ribosomal protein L16 [Candidatus Woesearchaeota archaeon]
MAKIRKAVAYRKLERPYTRISKFREKNYVRVRPHSVISRFDNGETKKDVYLYPLVVDLISKKALQIRHNAIESARQTSNRLLEKEIGKTGWHLKIRVYPHHVLRENPLASGAGADRMSTGMQASFGKPISSAAQVHEGQPVMTLGITKDKFEVAKKALRRAASKLPCTCQIVVARS